MNGGASALSAENALLGKVVDDLQSQLAHAQQTSDAAVHTKLKQTEDALLDVHTECKQVREALRTKEQALLEVQRDCVRLRHLVQSQQAASSVTERTLSFEVASAEMAQRGAADCACAMSAIAAGPRGAGGRDHHT